MQNNRRQFYIFDLEIAARKIGAAVPSMNELLPIFQQMHATSRTYPIRSSTGTVLIGDITIDAAQQFFSLLIRLSDRTTPNSVYSDPAAGQFNEHLKGANEGSDFGCHALISIAPEQGLPNIYTCAVERVPGLPFALVGRLLSKLLGYEFKKNRRRLSIRIRQAGLIGRVNREWSVVAHILNCAAGHRTALSTISTTGDFLG